MSSNCFDGLVQDCSNSIANTLELLQSYTKSSVYLKFGIKEGRCPMWELSFMEVVRVGEIRVGEVACEHRWLVKAALLIHNDI